MSQEIDKPNSEFPELEDDIETRRRFMKRTLNITAALAAAGLSEAVLEAALMGDAHAAEKLQMKTAPPRHTDLPPTQVRALTKQQDFANAVSMAAHEGNTTKALSRYGSKLDPAQKEMLTKLSTSDLRTLMTLKRKLEGDAAMCCDAGATVF